MQAFPFSYTPTWHMTQPTCGVIVFQDHSVCSQDLVSPHEDQSKDGHPVLLASEKQTCGQQLAFRVPTTGPS